MTSRRQKAQALVEFALILPVLLLVLLGTVDAGRLIFAYNSVSNAAREGGRTAIINQTPADVRQRAAEQATVLGIPSADPGGCPATGGPTTQPTGICFVLRNRDDTAACATPPTIGCTAIVSAKWEYRAITPVIGDLIGPLSVSSTTRQLVESVCVNPPDTCSRQ
ncbi:MAG TPA: TadE family protein [Actinomycetes bacterium]|nr:TadE family protein [Actinomycetes bacterium]